MFICMSSGARPRYRQDVILALAMPEGSSLQFRYDLKWIAPKVIERIKNGSFKNVKALISYIDQQDKTKIPELVPCRFARITNSKIHGTTATLRFKLEKFAFSEDLQTFNNQVRSLSGDTLPTWKENEHIEGFYWIEVDTKKSSSVISSEELGRWEKTVNQIAPRKDFENERYFYMIEGVYQVKNEKKLRIEQGSYQLEPSTEYEVRIYHFHPTGGKRKGFLQLKTKSASVAFTTNPLLSIDSRYDMKKVRFRTGSPATAEQGLISIYRCNGDADDKLNMLDFDLQLRTAGTWGRTLILSIVIGILLAAPHITAALCNNQLSGGVKTAVVLVAGIAGISAAILATFNLKKAI